MTQLLVGQTVHFSQSEIVLHVLTKLQSPGEKDKEWS